MADLRATLEQLRAIKRDRDLTQLKHLYPEEGPLRRELYQPQMEFFKAGQWARERCMIAANGVGKTWGVGGYEVTTHLTGDYPDWWEGRRFAHPVHIWVAGDTNTTVRDILQVKLLGPPGAIGTGLIPYDRIDHKSIRSRAGVPDAIESVRINSVFGGQSWLGFKSFEQGRKSFQGTEKHVIWLDEETDPLVYDECLMRTRTVNGMVMTTFTPLSGLTPVVLGFMPNGKIPADGKVNKSRFVVNATWEDAPHLTEKEREEILSNTLPHLRDARSKGVPHLGSGAIYPIAEEEVAVDDFVIPAWWPRVYALDYGWGWTAAVWLAIDVENDTHYIYDCYKRGQAEPPVHIAAIKARGDWIPGVADPAGGSSQRDGRKLLIEYQGMLSNLYPADNAVEAGLLRVWGKLVAQKLKVFKSCRAWFDEFRVYSRDEKGRVTKRNDHLMDCTRYVERSGVNYAICPPDEDDNDDRVIGKLGRNTITGY